MICDEIEKSYLPHLLCRYFKKGVEVTWVNVKTRREYKKTIRTTGEGHLGLHSKRKVRKKDSAIDQCMEE